VLSPSESRFYELVGERVRAHRKDLTQQKLADLIGVKRTSITNLERGRQNVPLHFLLRLARALGCEMGELLPAPEELEESPLTSMAVAIKPKDFDRMPEKTSAVLRQYAVVTDKETR
jgi:transcriptional regulator with XRE-family HTH domain